MWPILKSKQQILKEKETVYKLTSINKEVSEMGTEPALIGPDSCTFTNVNDSKDTYTVNFHSPNVFTDSVHEGTVYYEGRFVLNNLSYYTVR